jgi:tol-pal system protein YbgF
MHPKIKLLSLFLLLPLTGCFASKGDLTLLQSDIEEIRNRTVRLDKELAGMRSYCREEVEKASKGVTLFQDGLTKDMDALRKTVADSQANIDGAKVDTRVLAGRVDDMEQLLKKPAEDLSLMKEDLERRLAEVSDHLKKLDKALEELGKKNGGNTDDLKPEALYQKGVDLAKGGSSQQAREILHKFVETNPGHDLVANARYWIGETHYSEKNYEQSILEFQKLIKDFPGKEKVPAAMLKQGMAFKELGDTRSARFVYKNLIEKFPLAPETKTAKEKLKDLK